jgi:prepilin-type N-terminal cleavage/methylation domain-containing protein
MTQVSSLGRRRSRTESGFTLPEVLLAALIITIAFVTLLAVIPYSSAAVQSGSQTSTATFLADRKLEEAKLVPWTSSPDNDCLGISPGTPPNAAPRVSAGKTCTLNGVVINAGEALPWAADENAAQITNFNGYSRNVRVTDCGVGLGCAGIVDAGMRLVTVSVTFTPGVSVNSAGASARTVSVSMLVSQR